SYSGPPAAWTYKSISEGVSSLHPKRVFILGPSHHVYIDGRALSRCHEYATPLGNLSLDLEIISEFRNAGSFSDMDLETDEAEHSNEMLLPYVQEGRHKNLAFLVGAIEKENEKAFEKLFAPFLARDDAFRVVSSDFCRW
ncbi:MEMO1 family, partial [Phellopilus nigrolimitatus]